VLFDMILVLIVGAVVGSFLNMLIYRLPLKISLISPNRSFCPKCKKSISPKHNIPIISYIFLKGKCAMCHEAISTRYIIVELLSGFVALVLFLKLNLNTDFFIVCVVFYLLILLSFIDLKYKAVPDYLLVLVLITSMFYSDFDITAALLFAGSFSLLEFFVTFYIQNIKYKITKDKQLLHMKALGEGDIPIVAVIGGVLGVYLGAIGVVVGALVALLPSLINKELKTAFIPYLSIGLFVVFLFDDMIKVWF